MMVLLVTESFQELVFLAARYHNIFAILHFDLASISPNITFNIVQIDDIRMMWAEENICG